MIHGDGALVPPFFRPVPGAGAVSRQMSRHDGVVHDNVARLLTANEGYVAARASSAPRGPADGWP